MSTVGWGVAVVCALVGWGLVTWIDPRVTKALPRGLVVAELGERGHHILDVSSEASGQEIEQAYHSSIAECDLVRFSPTATVDEKQKAAARRREIDEAYGFIRPLKQ